MTEPDITVATTADRPRVISSLVAAFADDPVLRYLFPDDPTYPRYAAVFFGRLFDKRVHQATVWTIGHGASVAMWDAPANDSLVEPLSDDSLVEPVPDDSLAAHLPADALARVTAYDDAVRAALPAAPYWYLGVLGTHPAHAGRRWGRAAMAAGLRRAAADGLPAVLETSNPANVQVYRRAGWEVVRAVPGAPLTTWIMQRSAGSVAA